MVYLDAIFLSCSLAQHAKGTRCAKIGQETVKRHGFFQPLGAVTHHAEWTAPTHEHVHGIVEAFVFLVLPFVLYHVHRGGNQGGHCCSPTRLLWSVAIAITTLDTHYTLKLVSSINRIYLTLNIEQGRRGPK